MPQTSRWIGAPSIKGSTESVRMALLTASLIGLQFTWGLEMTYCTPYLLELGLHKSQVSLVWIAGPLSGMIVQPVIGVIADRSTSRWGRRRPFMVYGTVVVGMCLYVLGWTKEIIGSVIGDEPAHRHWTILLAVLSIYAVDFAINVVQASCRSLVIDTLPIPQQQMGSAWASRMVSVGSLLGYFAGSLDLAYYFGDALGNTQFKRLTALAMLTLCCAVGVTSFAVTERVLLLEGQNEERAGPFSILSQLFKKATNLPSRIAAICKIQLFAQVGWFPFMFYSTTWVGEIYIRSEAPHVVSDEHDTLGEVGRVGSKALIIFSIVTFAGSVLYPFLIKSPQKQTRNSELPSEAESLEKYKPRLQTCWMFGHLIFTSTMFWAPAVATVHAATYLVAVCGIPWAIQCWAPFAFLGVEINRLGQTSANGYADERDRKEDVELTSSKSSSRGNLLDDISQDASAEDTGVYLGILNLFTTMSQFISIAISWVVFSVLEPGKSKELAKDAHPDEHASTEGINAISVCLSIGAISLAGASLMTRRFRRMAS